MIEVSGSDRTCAGARRGAPGPRAPWRAWTMGLALYALLAPPTLARAQPAAEEAMKLESPAFTASGEIPVRFTCDGRDVSPPLAWSDLPEGTRSLALVVDDPDAPDPAAPKRVWVHWVLYNLPPDAGGLVEGASPDGLPEGALPGSNDWKRTGYGGPCPPIGRHRYFHRLYALDVVLKNLGKPDKAALLRALQGHVLAEAELVGTYQR